MATNYGEVAPFCIPVMAAGTIGIYTVVKLTTAVASGPAVLVCADEHDAPLGIAQHAAVDGDQLSVAISGVSLVQSNGAYAVGDTLMVAASTGKVDTGTESAGDTYWAIGRALELAGAGSEYHAVAIDITNIQVDD